MTAALNRPAPRERSQVKAVALPTEHGGWGLTAEPAVLGLIIAPSAAGAFLAAAAFVTFLVRTPAKLVLVDRRRHRTLPRTRLARNIAVAEFALLIVLTAAAFALAEPWFWVPAIAAAPFIGVQAWYEVRSKGRRLIPELAGAIGVSAVAAMIILAGGHSTRLAVGAWLILSARAVTSIPYVRTQIARLRATATSSANAYLTDGLALAIAALAVAIDHRLVIGSLSIAIVIIIQRVWELYAIPRPVILGLRQTAIGFGVVIATAIGAIALTN